MVKDAQVGVLRRRRMEGKTQEAVSGGSRNERAECAEVAARGVPVAAARAAHVANAAGSV